MSREVCRFLNEDVVPVAEGLALFGIKLGDRLPQRCRTIVKDGHEQLIVGRVEFRPEPSVVTVRPYRDAPSVGVLALLRVAEHVLMTGAPTWSVRHEADGSTVRHSTISIARPQRDTESAGAEQAAAKIAVGGLS